MSVLVNAGHWQDWGCVRGAGAAFLHILPNTHYHFGNGHSNRNEVPPPCGLDVQFLHVKQ